MLIAPLTNIFNAPKVYPATGLKLRDLASGAYRDLYHDVRSGLNTAKATLEAQLLRQSAAQLRNMARAQIGSQYSRTLTSTATMTRQGTLNNYNVKANYQVSANEAFRTASFLESTKTTKSGATKQTTEVDQQKVVTGTAQSESDKTVNSDVAVASHKEGGVTVKETDITTHAAQTTSRQADTQAITDTEKLVTTQKAGKPAQQAYSEQVVVENTATTSNQTIETDAARKIVQATTTDKSQVGNLKVNQTVINTSDTTQANTELNASAHTDYAALITNLNANGEVVSERALNRTTDTTEAKNIATEDTTNTQRIITQATEGKTSLTSDVVKQTNEMNQSIQGTTTILNTTLDAQGNPVKAQQTVVETQTDVARQGNFEAINLIAKGPQGVVGQGIAAGQAETAITTNVQTTAPNGNVTDRQIQRDITTDTTREWQGAITQQSVGGTTNFNVSNVDVATQQTQDVTLEGAKGTQVNTGVISAKEVTGNIAYTPQTGQVNSANAPQATIAVSFGTYTGLASGFKFDTGEVTFNLSFQSAQMTQQDTSKITQNGQAPVLGVQAGQLNDATLSGKMTSSVNDQGQRVIEISATYGNESDKFVVENGVRKDLAVGGADTTAEITGRFVISQTGDTKSVQSQLDIYKVQNSEAEGTGMAAVKTAVAQNDPLRSGFVYDSRGFRINLGFATLNLQIYA